jgi:hypothetical protein
VLFGAIETRECFLRRSNPSKGLGRSKALEAGEE